MAFPLEQMHHFGSHAEFVQWLSSRSVPLDRGCGMTVKVDVKPEKVPMFLQAMTELSEASRLESGNISFDLNASLQSQSTFYVLEKWNTFEALRQHGQEEHVRKLGPTISECLLSQGKLMALYPIGVADGDEVFPLEHKADSTKATTSEAPSMHTFLSFSDFMQWKESPEAAHVGCEPFGMTLKMNVLPDKIPTFLQLMRENARGSLLEPGCLQFDLNGSFDSPTVFYCVEAWQSFEAMKFHFQQPYLLACAEGLPGCLHPEHGTIMAVYPLGVSDSRPHLKNRV